MPSVPAKPSGRRDEAPNEAVNVLSVGEAAARLGISRRELEAMIAAGKIEALWCGFGSVIPTHAIERLTGPAKRS